MGFSLEGVGVGEGRYCRQFPRALATGTVAKAFNSSRRLIVSSPYSEQREHFLLMGLVRKRVYLHPRRLG